MSTEYIEYPSAPTPQSFPLRRSFSWSGVFAGTFLFLAIEATFGALAVAIFARMHPLMAAAGAPGTRAAPGTPGVGIGGGVWLIVLSIIAMYFAGKLAAKLSGSVTRNTGMYAGLVTFGMAIFSLILIAEMAFGSPIGGAGTGFAANTHLANVIVAGGWYLFVGLILSMASAGIGGVHGSIVGGRRQQPPLAHPMEPRKVA